MGTCEEEREKDGDGCVFSFSTLSPTLFKMDLPTGVLDHLLNFFFFS